MRNRTSIARLLIIVVLLMSIPDLVTVDATAPAALHEGQSLDAPALLRRSADATHNAGAVRYVLTMQMTTTSIRGDAWTQDAHLTGWYVAPDSLQGVLTITNPWSETSAEVIVAGGEAYVTNPRTGVWETGLQRATSYYPVIVTGCLLRMAEADTDRLALAGSQKLDGAPVYVLQGTGGADDQSELAYWVGVRDGLLRRATVRTGKRSGWSNEADSIQVTATLDILGYGEPVRIAPPVAG